VTASACNLEKSFSIDTTFIINYR